jgi:3-hydroxy acid dehydrogenase/malonic semialdehyde reductase
MSNPARDVFRPSVVFVTGASAGFGAAIVRRFASGGARVVAAARREERLEQLAAELGKDRVHPLVLDVSDDAAVARAVEGLPPDFAAVDLLVNNAGMAVGMEPAQRAKADDWAKMIDVNCKGLAFVTQALLPGMVARGRGHVVNLGSVAGTYPYPGGNVYGATKAFVHQLSLNLRSDLHGTGVRVTCIEPGMATSEFSQVRFGGDKAKADAVYKGMTPLSPEDIAATVEWVATQPPHLNVNVLELMPVAQSFAAFQVDRK